jgi:hypothetical protein
MRLFTQGGPAQVLVKIGKANNLLDRELARMRTTGQQTGRVRMDGMDLRLDKNGIHQMKIDAPAKDQPQAEERKEPDSGVVIYNYQGSMHGAISHYPDIDKKSFIYFGTMPARDVIEAMEYDTIVLYEPRRILTDTEKKVFKALTAKGIRMVLFPGGDLTIFNAILEQIGSIFEVIPLASELFAGIYGKKPDGNLLYFPVTKRGWLKVRNDYAHLATVKDPFGRGLAFSNIVTICPAFYYKISAGFDLSAIWPENFISEAEDHYGTGVWYCTKNSMYPSGYALDDWPALSKASFISWLESIQDDMPLIDKAPLDFVFSRNDKGWVDYTDINQMDWVSANLAYYTDNIMVAGFSPFWFCSDYNPEYESTTSIKEFSSWLGQKWDNVDVFSQWFYNMPPYLYTLGTSYAGGIQY